MFHVNTNRLVNAIREHQKEYEKMSDQDLRRASLAVRYELMSGAKLSMLIPRAFGLVAEASQRTIGLNHYDVQFVGGIHMALGRIVEMKTGEGKTLTATLPTYLYALGGKGAHIVTVNDYLAQRDAELMRPVFQLLGLSVGCVLTEMEPAERKVAYQKDVTYGTAKEFGFDFLRDRMAIGGIGGQSIENQVLRELYFVLIDEADSILIDEARTPLIIGMVNPSEEKIAGHCYRWAAAVADQFIENVDYRYDHKKRSVKLKPAGIRRLRCVPELKETQTVGIRELYKYIENAIRVHRDFQKDRHYAVKDDKIVIVDEFTGRPAEGRQWQDGLHQAVEAREDLDITPRNKQAAVVTVQSFFRLYRHSTGMTGTAWDSRREFKRVFKKKIRRIPTHKPIKRTKYPTKILANEELKFRAIVDEIKQVIDSGRAVLVGTRTVDKSEKISELLSAERIIHTVLNAKFLEREAEIVKQAGQLGAVTVATNMAGRGTDIILNDQVRDAGGLHVILSELHESRRIDWQLIGRGSRQGDPGSFRVFVSLDDQLLLFGLGPKRHKRLIQKFESRKSIPNAHFRKFVQSQNRLEKRYRVDRLVLQRHNKDRNERLMDMGEDPYLAASE